jgi:hypothetical protein
LDNGLSSYISIINHFFDKIVDMFSQACAVLHNFLIQGSDLEIENDDQEEATGGSLNDSELLATGTKGGNQKRKDVMVAALQFRLQNTC